MMSRESEKPHPLEHNEIISLIREVARIEMELAIANFTDPPSHVNLENRKQEIDRVLNIQKSLFTQSQWILFERWAKLEFWLAASAKFKMHGNDDEHSREIQPKQEKLKNELLTEWEREFGKAKED